MLYQQTLNLSVISFPDVKLQYVWQWLCNDYYSTKPDDNPETRQYLEKAKDHLVHHDSSGGHFVPMYPRVKLLLGDPIDEVESEFKGQLPHVTNIPKVKLCEHYGRFLECIGRKDEGIQQCMSAIRANNAIKGSSYKPWLAINVLTRNNIKIPRN